MCYDVDDGIVVRCFADADKQTQENIREQKSTEQPSHTSHMIWCRFFCLFGIQMTYTNTVTTYYSDIISALLF